MRVKNSRAWATASPNGSTVALSSKHSNISVNSSSELEFSQERGKTLEMNEF